MDERVLQLEISSGRGGYRVGDTIRFKFTLKNAGKGQYILPGETRTPMDNT